MMAILALIRVRKIAVVVYVDGNDGDRGADHSGPIMMFRPITVIEKKSSAIIVRHKMLRSCVVEIRWNRENFCNARFELYF